MEFRDIALIYGGEWIGKGADKVISLYAPPEYMQLTKLVLAAGLPLSTQFLRLSDRVETIFLLVGAFLATKA